MPLYRRMAGQPVECAQFLSTNATQPKGVEEDAGGFYVTTIQLQQVYLTEGDWVIPESDGEHYYPCADSVFQSIYERIESGISKQVYDAVGDELGNPPADILDDPTDSQAAIGHKAHR